MKVRQKLLTRRRGLTLQSLNSYKPPAGASCHKTHLSSEDLRRKKNRVTLTPHGRPSAAPSAFSFSTHGNFFSNFHSVYTQNGQRKSFSRHGLSVGRGGICVSTTQLRPSGRFSLDAGQNRADGTNTDRYVILNR